MILIVGDRHSIIEYAVESGVKLIILSGDAEIKEKHLEIAKQNKVNIMRTPYDTYHIAKLVSLTMLAVIIGNVNCFKSNYRRRCFSLSKG